MDTDSLLSSLLSACKMISTIESLDDTLMQCILRFLCGPKPESIDAYSAELQRCERVCKWFRRIVADDKLWGFWSVQDEANMEGSLIYLTVPDYGPNNESYDYRLHSWRELTQCKAVLQRIQRITRDGDDGNIFGFEDKDNIVYFLAQQAFGNLPDDNFYPWSLDGLSFALRKDSAQMLFTLTGLYIENLFRTATRLVIHPARINEESCYVYPTVNSRALQHPSYPSHMPIPYHWGQDKNAQFDTLIRRIAYRAGTVKLEACAFEYAKSLYFQRLEEMLHDACTVILCESSESSLYTPDYKKKISNAAEAFHVHPGVFFEERKESWSVMPVPKQFEDANQRLSNEFVKPRVYGVQHSTLSLPNLEDHYEIENHDVESDDSNSYYEPNTEEDTDDDETMFDILQNLDMISKGLDDIKAEILEKSTLNQGRLAQLISDLQDLSSEHF